MVMDKGSIAEFDSPQNLLARHPPSMFAALVANWDKEAEDN
jgi:ABC-type multidrug transport system fused ATPase/permease subunit